MAGTRAIIHLDMDAFYASVEQLDHPAYRGKPVVVGADPRGGKGRGVVAACSYEARSFGVRSALPISQAYRLCPHAIYVQPRMSRYSEMSGRMFAILREYTDLVEPLSIDEAFLAGLKELEVIHGAGTGRLRKAIREHLREHGFVKAFGPGGPGRGGDGVTVVEIGASPAGPSGKSKKRPSGDEG